MDDDDQQAYLSCADVFERYMDDEETAILRDERYTADIPAALRRAVREMSVQQLRIGRRLHSAQLENAELRTALGQLCAGEELAPERFGIRVDPKKVGDDGGAGCIAEGLIKRIDELSDRQNALEALLDRCGGHKVRALQLLMAFEARDDGITVDFGAMPEPGEPIGGDLEDDD